MTEWRYTIEVTIQFCSLAREKKAVLPAPHLEGKCVNSIFGVITIEGKTSLQQICHFIQSNLNSSLFFLLVNSSNIICGSTQANLVFSASSSAGLFVSNSFSYLAPFVYRVVDLGVLVLGLPGWIDHRHGLQTQLGTRQSELDLGR